MKANIRRTQRLIQSKNKKIFLIFLLSSIICGGRSETAFYSDKTSENVTSPADGFSTSNKTKINVKDESLQCPNINDGSHLKLLSYSGALIQSRHYFDAFKSFYFFLLSNEFKKINPETKVKIIDILIFIIKNNNKSNIPQEILDFKDDIIKGIKKIYSKDVIILFLHNLESKLFPLHLGDKIGPTVDLLNKFNNFYLCKDESSSKTTENKLFKTSSGDISSDKSSFPSHEADDFSENPVVS